MYKVTDENLNTFTYENIEKIKTVSDLKKGHQYIFVQEEEGIVIWRAINEIKDVFPKDAAKDLKDYYKRFHDRGFDIMTKVLLSL